MGAGGMQGGGGQRGMGSMPGQIAAVQPYTANFLQRLGLTGQQQGPAGPGGGKPIMPFMGGFPQQAGGLAGLAGLGGPQTQQAAMNQNLPGYAQTYFNQLQQGQAPQLSPVNQTTQADIMGQSGQAPQPGYDRPLFETQMRQQQSLAPQMAKALPQSSMDQATRDFLAQQNFVSQRPDGMMIQKPAGPMPANPMAMPQQVKPEDPSMQAMRLLQQIRQR